MKMKCLRIMDAYNEFISFMFPVDLGSFIGVHSEMRVYQIWKRVVLTYIHKPESLTKKPEFPAEVLLM